MTLYGRLTQATRLGSVVIAKPSEARNIHRLLSTRGHSTLDLRVPWLPFAVIDFLGMTVDATSSVFEYGGGGSTAWFADRVGHVTTVEHDDTWYPTLARMMRQAENATVLHRSASSGFDDYAGVIDEYDDDTFDMVLVDGRRRVVCVEHSVSKVKPGGLLILDDSDRPEYASAHALLYSWQKRELFGLVPCKDRPGTTTIWTKPDDHTSQAASAL